MQAQSKVSTNWKQPLATAAFTTGVSLHSHTSCSEETLGFIHKMGVALPGMGSVLSFYEKRASERYSVKLDFDRANWRPPLQPRMAYDLEAKQIQRLGLYPLVSITDHDTLEGTLLLRAVPSSRHIPMSVEWSAPYGQTVFHLGIHNLPSGTGTEWMSRLEAYTAAPNDAKLVEMLRELNEQPHVLIVFNHPLWDLHKVGPAHVTEARRFMAEVRGCIHALELNGLRHAQENREVGRMARELGYLLISGGDRHGLEPNANINLTHATSFNEFVHEIRRENRSHVLFMPQYAEPWKHRIMRSTLDAIRDYPDFPEGSRRWDERVYHPDQNGVDRPISQLWPDGQAPVYMRAVIQFVRMLGSNPISNSLRFAWNESHEVQFALGELEAF